MRALIITGGEIREDVALPEYDFAIAADSGLLTAERLGVFPDLIVGDFDSLDRDPDEEYTDSVTGNISEIIRHPAKKNETDTMLAAEYAVKRGAAELYIIGGLSGRADHTLSNVFLLEQLADDGVPAVYTDGENELRVVQDGESAHIQYGEYRYFSTVAMERSIVTVSGCAYPLFHERLVRQNAYAVSNEALPGGAKVTVHEGSVLVIRSERL